MKEKLFKKGIKRRLFSVVLALSMVVTLMPMNSLTVYADLNSAGTCTKHPTCDHIKITGDAVDGLYPSIYYWTNGTSDGDWQVDSENFTEPLQEGTWLYDTGDDIWAICDGHGGSGGGTAWTKVTIAGKNIWYCSPATAPDANTVYCSNCHVQQKYDSDDGWLYEQTCDHITTIDPTGGSGGPSWSTDYFTVSGKQYYCDTAVIAENSDRDGWVCSACGDKLVFQYYVGATDNFDACLAAGHWKLKHNHGDFSENWTQGTDGHWHACGVDGCDVTTENDISSHTADGFAYAAHSYDEYSAHDNVLTASCVCGKSVSLTLTASNANYSGISGLSDFNTATGLDVKESDVKFYKVETANTTTGGTLYAGELYEGRPSEEGYYYAELTVGEDTNSATAKLAFKTGKVISAQNLEVGTVVKAGDIITRPAGFNYVYLNFGNFYFGLAETDAAKSIQNKIDSWTMKSEFPSYTDGTLPDWYNDTTVFKVDKVQDFGKDIYFVPVVHTWTYSANGATLTATCDRECGAETAHTATLTLTASSPNYSGSPVSKAKIFSGMDFTEFNNATGLNLSASDIKLYAATDASKATALDEINAAGLYVAELTVDTNKTATLEFEVISLPTAVHTDGCGHPNVRHFYFVGTTYMNEGIINAEGVRFDYMDEDWGSSFWNKTNFFKEDNPRIHTKLSLFPQDAQAGWYYWDENKYLPCNKPQHTHNFTYSADGAKLTATCGNTTDCTIEGETKAVSLILTATSPNYSGSAATITIGTEPEKSAWTGAGLTIPTTISYETSTGTDLSTTAPTAAGSYVAKVSPVGVTATADNTAKVSFTIEEKYSFKVGENYYEWFSQALNDPNVSSSPIVLLKDKKLPQKFRQIKM